MDLIDLAGAQHDSNLRKRMARRRANRIMIGEMVSQTSIPAYITLIFWLSLWLYRVLPREVTGVYWRMV